MDPALITVVVRGTVLAAVAEVGGNGAAAVRCEGYDDRPVAIGGLRR